jgi:hypothetical protein
MRSNHRPDLCRQVRSITAGNTTASKKSLADLNHAGVDDGGPAATVGMLVPLVGVDTVPVRANHRSTDVRGPLVARDLLEHGFTNHMSSVERQHLIGTDSTSICVAIIDRSWTSSSTRCTTVISDDQKKPLPYPVGMFRPDQLQSSLVQP